MHCTLEEGTRMVLEEEVVMMTLVRTGRRR